MMKCKLFFQKIAENGNVGYLKRSTIVIKQACVLEKDSTRSLEAQSTTITNKLNAIEAKLEGKEGGNCGLCLGSHFTDQCPLITETVNFFKD